MTPVKLTAALIESFAGVYLSPRYDDPQPTPQLHRECWELYCSDHPQCLAIAPRDHAKSTALTFDYILAEVCFRTSDYVILIGSTEDMAAEQLSNIREELAENDELRAHFGISSFEKESTTDIIIRCADGHRFRILARGAEQKIRGKMWKGKRPNLLVCDDMEDDEQVENKDRRAKFRHWFFRAAKQAVAQKGKTRVHGTILHEDSLLSRLRKNAAWNHVFYKAHRSFGEFVDLLWPERWTEAKLRSRQLELVQDGDAAGYSQEYLNEPADVSNPYLRKDDFLPMYEEDHRRPKVYGVGVDLAISKKDHANRTSFTIGGKCSENLLHVVDERVDRWSSDEIIEEFFSIQKAWRPIFFWVEDGKLWLSISTTLYKEMQKRDIYLNIFPRPAIGDKAARGKALQARHRAHGMRFDREASWYEEYKEELLKFRADSEATLDDQFDSSALLARGFEEMAEVDDEDFIGEEEQEFDRESERLRSQRAEGRSRVTGY